MEELKIGEWGRTNLGNIIKFAWIEEEPGVRAKNKVVLIDLLTKTVNCFYYFKKNEFIKSHSKKIIDLIENGDFVNERYVVCVEKHKNRIIVEVNYGKCRLKELKPKDIKSIVTKEQFDQMKYIVGDESNVKD